MSTRLGQVVCLKGHQHGDNYRQGQQVDAFCSICGSANIVNCPSCSALIPGEEIVTGVVFISSETVEVPSYCPNCGKPYPWTVSNIEAANELIKLTNLEDDQKQDLVESFPDLLVETPKTKVAALKFKRYLAKTGDFAGQAVHDFLVDVCVEAGKQILFPS